MERVRHQAAVDARAARTVHARDVAQNTELLAQLTVLRKEVPSSHPTVCLSVCAAKEDMRRCTCHDGHVYVML